MLFRSPERLSHVIRPFASATPEHPALVAGRTVWSYGELAAIVAETTLALQRYHIRPGDRVLVASENSLALVALILACSEIDAWAVVVNPRLSDREIDLIREHSGARRAFYTVEVSEAARAHAVRHGASTAEIGRLGLIGVSPLNEVTLPEPVAADGAEQVAALLYTSGTTGNPKGVMLTHRNVLFNARVSGLLRQVKPDDRTYGMLPMSHIVGFSIILASSFMFGSTVHVVSRPDPAGLVAAIAEDGISILPGVPATYQRLLEYKATTGMTALPRGRLRALFVAGAPLDMSLKSKIEAEFGLPLLNGYGITECAPGISGVRSSAPRADDAVGTVLPGVEVRLVGRHGKPVASGEVGELHARGPKIGRAHV